MAGEVIHGESDRVPGKNPTAEWAGGRPAEAIFEGICPQSAEIGFAGSPLSEVLTIIVAIGGIPCHLNMMQTIQREFRSCCTQTDSGSAESLGSDYGITDAAADRSVNSWNKAIVECRAQKVLGGKNIWSNGIA